MNTVLMITFILIGFLALIPVVNMRVTKNDTKYTCLKYLMNVSFVWTLLIFMEKLVPNTTIVYYSHLLGYPLKFLLAALMVCTIFNYIEMKMPKALFYILALLFALELVIALTNTWTLFFLELSLADMTSSIDLYAANKGILFIVHLILSYSFLLAAVIFLFAFLAKNKNVRQYMLVTRIMAASVIVVLLFNLLQLIGIEASVDLTHISLVLVSYALYQAIYKRDMVFNLKTSGRGEILSNMREIYILTDREYNVIEVSKLLIEKYDINEQEVVGKHLDILKKELSNKLVLYSEYDVDSVDAPNKDHFHMREKKFTLQGMNDYGYMILLYDETQVFSLLRELNKLSNYDNMTGLNNRNYMESKLEHIEDNDNTGVISLDLNGLKANNDYLGHERGDYLLKSLANKMKIVMASYENKHMARIGGDEFLIVLKDTTLDTINQIKEDILKECLDEDITLHVSVSIGVALSNQEKSIYKTIQEADKDMYQMKQVTSKEYSKLIVDYAQKSGKYIR